MTTYEAEYAAIRDLVAAEPAADADSEGYHGRLQRVCRTATRHLDASGTGVSVLSEEGGLMTVAASSPHVAEIEDLQFALGEGPCLAAYATRSPVLIRDFDRDVAARWPAYAPAARALGVRSVFAFPLQVGLTRLGALDVYRKQAGSLSAASVTHALIFAEIALLGLLDAASAEDSMDQLVEDAAANRYEVYQAQGMLMAQLGVPGPEALVRLRAHAFWQGRPISEVARDVVERRIILEGHGDDRST